MECLNCEEVKLDENYVCKKCKLKLCCYCEERMFDHYEDRMCSFCDEDYCQVCTRYLSEGMHGLCRSCLATAAELYIEKNAKISVVSI